MTLGQLYQQALSDLGQGAVDRFSILALIQHHEAIASKDILLTHLDWPANQVESFLKSFQRLKKGEPVAYIIGHTTFLNLTLKVNPSVLIPRQETEELVMLILKTFPKDKGMNVVDIGTGSGAIALALKSFRPWWNILATDISSDALAVAQKNAVDNHLEIETMLSDGFKNLPGRLHQKIDLVVSNPPYVKSLADLDPSVAQYEPHLALIANPVSQFYEQYLQEAKAFLTSNGVFVFELGTGVINVLTPIIEKLYPKAKITTVNDINHKERFVIIYT
jgi:release factor glutamine methyltransferase